MASEIRSYRSVFDLERRIYRVDRLRLNPAGVPVRGIVYFLALLLATLLIAALPLIGSIARLLPWFVRELAVPGAGAALLTLIRVEGRPFHLAALALASYAVGPRQFAGLRPLGPADRRWRPEDLLILADGSDSRLRRIRYVGPGAVLVSVAHLRSEWQPSIWRRLARRADMQVARLPGKPRPARGQVIALGEGARFEVK